MADDEEKIVDLDQWRAERDTEPAAPMSEPIDDVLAHELRLMELELFASLEDYFEHSDEQREASADAALRDVRTIFSEIGKFREKHTMGTYRDVRVRRLLE